MRRKMNVQRDDDVLLTDKAYRLDEIRNLARIGGWLEIETKTDHRNQGIMFQRTCGIYTEKITYWFLSRKQTVRTYVFHPKHGPGQSHTIEPLTRGELKSMFLDKTAPGTGLRLHTNNKRRRDMASVRDHQRK